MGHDVNYKSLRPAGMTGRRVRALRIHTARANGSILQVGQMAFDAVFPVLF